MKPIGEFSRDLVATAGLPPSRSATPARPPSRRSTPKAVDRLIDVELPKLFSAWKGDGELLTIVRPLTRDQWEAVTARINELRDWLAPRACEREAIQAAISAMLVGFRSMRQSQEAAEAVSAIATHNLRKFPLWAVQRGCELISQGKVAGLDRRWPPNDTEIYAVVAEQVNCPRADLDRAEALLAASVEPPPEPENRPTRAEIEAQLGRPIGNGVKAWIEPPRPRDGKHMARVLADLELRKQRNSVDG
jgi:hypothetical protein